jgi:hypothetical protein
MGSMEHERTLNLDIHENKIAKSILWAFGFGRAYVCTTILYYWYFLYDDVITISINAKPRKGLLAWCNLSSMAH